MSKKTEDKPKLSLKSLDKKIDDIQLDLDKGDGIWQENLDSIHKGQRELHKRLHILELYRPKLYIEEKQGQYECPRAWLKRQQEEDADDKHAREQLVTFYKGIAYTALSIFVGFAIGWFCK